MTRALVLLLAGVWSAAGHVGSPDVFHEGQAGPYKLLVTIRPPAVIPGVAEVEVRSNGETLRTVKITPLPLTGDAARFAPSPDSAEPVPGDAGAWAGRLWMMVSGSWQVRVRVEGERGAGELSVPVPAVARSTQTMNLPLGFLLGLLGAVLAIGMVSIAGAAVREATLDPGMATSAERRSRAQFVMGSATAIVVVALYLGNLWWKAEALDYGRIIYKPLAMAASASAPSGRLELRLSDPGWIRQRGLDDFIPDHGHLMHLFVIRLPELDEVWHLHPRREDSGVFAHDLPAMPAGRYQLYADVVHGNGLAETLSAELELGAPVAGRPLEGDDSHGAKGAAAAAAAIRFVPPPGGFAARRPELFTFEMTDGQGNPAKDAELYMGMPGHAMFLRKDRGVFAHVHPGGTVPMAAIALTGRADPHAAHDMTFSVPSRVAFPYGFPTPGDYRIFVQMKRAGRVETASFDVAVKQN